MGKGDKRSKKGKIIKGTYGVSRPRTKSKAVVAPAPAAEKKETKAAPKAKAAKKAPAKKAPAKKTTAKAKEKEDKE